MSKDEIKQWIRNQIDSSLKSQDNNFKDLYYNKQYLRALKLSKITGQPVNKNDFKGGDLLFGFNAKYNTFCCYSKISNYLEENYSIIFSEICEIIVDVINEYDVYKGYKFGW